MITTSNIVNYLQMLMLNLGVLAPITSLNFYFNWSSVNFV